MTPSEILQFEPALESTAQADLIAQGATATYTRLDLTSDLPANRIVVEASGFVRASEQMGQSVDGEWFYNHYRGQLQFSLTTKRDNDGPALHRQWLGLVRDRLSRPRQILTGFPFDILRVAESTASVTYLNEGDRDRSDLVFDIELAIPGTEMNYAADAE